MTSGQSILSWVLGTLNTAALLFLQVSFGEQTQGGDWGRVENVSWSTQPSKQVGNYSFKNSRHFIH